MRSKLKGRCLVLLLLLLKCSLTCSMDYADRVRLSAKLPPLYGLDSWTQCQRPGDQYCSVDADLSSDTPSELMDIIQEYSKSRKHYNRTVISRGVCVSKCRTGRLGNLTADIQGCLNETIYREYGLQVSVQSVQWCRTAGEEPKTTDGARNFAIFTLFIVAITTIATTWHVYCERRGIQPNRYLLAFSLKNNWKILTYDRSKPRHDQRMKDLACFEFFRTISLNVVIMVHVLFFLIYSYNDNPEFLEQLYDDPLQQMISNLPLALQAIFTISAFISTYTVLIYIETRPFTWFFTAMSVASRWMRLTPATLYVLAFTIYWSPLLGSSPLWGMLVEREAEACSQRWYQFLFYMQNRIDLGNVCMLHTWTMAVDMQLHIIGILMLSLFIRGKVPVLSTLAGWLSLVALVSGTIAYVYDYDPVVACQSPEGIRTMFRNYDIIRTLYFALVPNMAGHIAGVAGAFLLYHGQKKGIDLDRHKWITLCYNLSLLVAVCISAGGLLYLSDERPGRLSRALYSSVDRVGVAICCGMCFLGIATRKKSRLKDLAMWRGFFILGRLSFSAYLVHFTALRHLLAPNTGLVHAWGDTIITLYIKTSLLSYVVAIPLCLCIEMPFYELWKSLVDSAMKKTHETNPTLKERIQ